MRNLQNDRNTCFIDAVLPIFAYIEPMASYFTDQKHNSGTCTFQQATKIPCLQCKLNIVVEQLLQDKRRYKAADFTNALRNRSTRSTTIKPILTDWNGAHEYDPHELILSIINNFRQSDIHNDAHPNIAIDWFQFQTSKYSHVSVYTLHCTTHILYIIVPQYSGLNATINVVWYPSMTTKLNYK